LIDDGRRSEVRLLKRNLKNEQVVAFLYSCYEGDMETIKYILIKGFDINQMDYDKRTGLHLAAA
jgi:ankyrin repeat protein